MALAIFILLIGAHFTWPRFIRAAYPVLFAVAYGAARLLLWGLQWA